MSDRSGLLEGGFRRGPVPHVAFEVDDLRRPDEILVDVGRREVGARPEIGVHRALAVRRDVDEAPSGRRPLLRRLGVERDPGRADVGDECVSERVAPDLADIGRRDAERGDADDGVGGRAARDDDRVHARCVELLGPVLLDERHRALHHLLRVEIGVVGVGENVDQRVAQPQNLDRFRHRPARGMLGRGLSHWRRARSIAGPKPVTAPAVSASGMDSTRVHERPPRLRWTAPGDA